jgi:hypothetical protein
MKYELLVHESQDYFDRPKDCSNRLRDRVAERAFRAGDNARARCNRSSGGRR